MTHRDDPQTLEPVHADEGGGEVRRWSSWLVLFLRAMAVLSLCKGLYHWAIICGIGAPFPSGFDSYSTPYQVATIFFAVIDPANDQLVGMHPVVKCKGNHGMALDAEHRRAFLVCGQNSVLTVLDLDKFEPVAYLPLADGGDVVKFDPGLNRIYVACYSGVISVFEQKDPQHYRKLGDVAVAHAVHSIAVDTETHRVYAPLQEQDGIPVARLMIYQASGK